MDDDGKINHLTITGEETTCEFDAMVTGYKHSFDKFVSNTFVSSYICSPPLEESDKDAHMCIVKVKLNLRLLKEWVGGSSGSKFSFFDDNMNTFFTKVLVISGGAKSAAFVKNLSSNEEMEEFAELKAAIIKNKINVFYKFWASTETFFDIHDRCEKLEIENQEVKMLCHELEIENQEAKKKLDMIVSMLNLKFNDEM